MDMITDNAPESFPPILRLRSQSGSENVHYSVLYEGFPDEFRLLAEKQLNETDEKRLKGMQKLKEIMKSKDMHTLNDIYLLAILRCCKYNLKKAEVKLKKFAVTHREIAIMGAKLDMSIVEDMIDDMCFGILPYRDKHGRFILYTRPYGLNSEKYSFDEVSTVVMICNMLLLTFPITTVTGLVYFADCRSPTLSVFYPIFRVFQSRVASFLSIPIRIGKAEILYPFTLIRWFYKLSALFLPAKLLKRGVFHPPNYDYLHQDYDPDMLPDVYGGNLGPLSSKFYKQRLLNFVKDLRAEYQEIGS